MSANLRWTLPAILAVAGLAAAAPENRPVPVRGPGPAGPARIEMDKPETTVPFRLEAGRPVVEATIDGKGPFRFVLDTGAGGTVVAQSLADHLQLPVIGEAAVGTPVGPETIPAKLVRIPQVGLGGARVAGVPAVALDLSHVFQGEDSPQGILSARLFEGFLLSLDYANAKVTLRRGSLPAPDGAETFEYRAKDRLPSITLSVAGLALEAHLDSGSSWGFTLPRSLAAKLPLASELAEIGRARLVTGESVLLGAKLNGTVRIGRYAFEDPDLAFSDAPIGNIGSRILRRFVVTVDPKNRRVRLEEAATAQSGAAGAP